MAITPEMVAEKYVNRQREDPATGMHELLTDILLVLAEMNERDRDFYEWIKKDKRG